MNALLICACAATLGAGPQPEAGFVVAANGVPAWMVNYQGKTIFQYRLAPDQKKPYVDVLATIEGENLLRDSPFDHLHHHGLMYAIRLSGTNFWEEVEPAGVERPVTDLETSQGIDDHGDPFARFGHRIEWLKPEDAAAADTTSKALLIEDRELTLTAQTEPGRVVLDWKARFEVGPGGDAVELHGSNYNGLGMRFLQELDPLADFWVGGRHIQFDKPQQVVTAPYAAVQFPRAAKPATILLVSSPANPDDSSRFFVMNTPFAYLSVTQGLDEQPRTYQRGDAFTLEYRLVVYSRLVAPGELDQAATAWRDSKRISGK